MALFGGCTGALVTREAVTAWSDVKAPAGMVTLLPLGSIMVPPFAAVTVCVAVSIVPLTVSEALALLVVSAALIALIFTVDGVGMVAGAVYRPAVEMIPTESLPPTTPLTLQVTVVLEVPITDAENCSVDPVWTVPEVGDTETTTFGVATGIDDGFFPPHPTNTANNAMPARLPTFAFQEPY
jgi:hypothetical protein